MKLKNILFISLALLIGLTVSPQVKGNENIGKVAVTMATTDDILIHTVMQGETVYSIAASYHTTVQEIYRLNPKAEKGIKTGEKIKIPRIKVISGYSSHLIEPKETLYSVSRMYKITEQDIKDANPGLSESNFRAGQRIKIPQLESNAVSYNEISSSANNGKNLYQVRKGETLYSIGKAHNVSVNDLLNANTGLRESGLKDGMSIVIPEKNSQKIDTGNAQIVTIDSEVPYAPKGDVVRVGILLPFLDSKGSIAQEKLAEYYEGFLLAVKNLKNKGLNAEIYTFDIGSEKNTKKLESLLGTTEINSLHLIIGGVSKQQIDVLTKFSKETGIKYVMPFGSTSQMRTSPTLFQVTSSHSSLYPEIVEAFKKQYQGYNIIFVSEAGTNNNESKFVAELKKGLSASDIQFKTTASSSSLTNDINKALNTSGKNVLIPTSSSELTLRRIISAINTVNGDITLFGYPEWQIYSQHQTVLHKYNSHIFSIYFVDENQREVQNFTSEFKKWYNKELINSFPKYAYLGYDAGLYFLTALNKYGSSFENEASRIKVATAQSAIHFERDGEQGGYINRGLYFIHYKTNSDIEKIDISNR